MSSVASEERRAMQGWISLFGIVWLTASNAVGVWLALLLLYPRIGNFLGALSYGRWMPLHTDWHLYGWCSLPLLGVLAMRLLGLEEGRRRDLRSVMIIWSSALIVGGVGWLAGEAGGKPFLNWAGVSKYYFPLALFLIWMVLAKAWWRGTDRRNRFATWESRIKFCVLAILLGVPISLFAVSRLTVYPPVDPDSGGATGHSLVASTLGLVAIVGLIPSWGLQKKALPEKRASVSVFWIGFAASCVVYLLMNHGNASNQQWDQILGLGSLLVWPGLIACFWRSFAWGRASRLWRWAFLAWWGLLAVDGWTIFLPGVLDLMKFSNGLVAHAHIAMAGMVTALNMIILTEVGDDDTVGKILGNRGWFFVWNLSLLVFVVALTLQGIREGKAPEVLFREDAGTTLAYQIRLFAGLGMFTSSFAWLLSLIRRVAFANERYERESGELKGVLS